MMVEVPIDRLDNETLERVLREIVTRDGTDYGESPFSTEQKVAQVLAQLRSKKAFLLFDTESELTNLVSAKDYRAANEPP